MAAAGHPRDALAAAAEGARSAGGATGVAILRMENGRPMPAFSQGVVLPPRMLSETILQRIGVLYPLMTSTRLEGILVLSGVTESDAAGVEEEIEPLLDLMALM